MGRYGTFHLRNTQITRLGRIVLKHPAFGNVNGRGSRILLATDEATSENPPAVNATTVFVMAASPYESPATKLPGSTGSEVDTYELTSGVNKTPIGTSSSPAVVAWARAWQLEE